MADPHSNHLFRYPLRWFDLSEDLGLTEAAVNGLEQRDRGLEFYLQWRIGNEGPQAYSASPGDQQMAGTEVELANLGTLTARPYRRRILLEGHVFVSGAATTAGVVGDVWELRIKRNGSTVHKARFQNHNGSSWQQTLSVRYATSIARDAAQVFTLTLARVSGSGGCRIFTDGTTNQYVAQTWPDFQ